MLMKLRRLFVRSRKLRGEEGTSALELLMTISVIFFILAASVQVALICCTKLITNYAAWISARVWAVNKDDAVGKAEKAGMEVLKSLRWTNITKDYINVQESNEGVEVRYKTTLGIPFLLQNDSTGRITTVGWGAVPRDPNGFDEAGDNRER
jgi:hypothetical protein